MLLSQAASSEDNSPVNAVSMIVSSSASLRPREVGSDMSFLIGTLQPGAQPNSRLNEAASSMVAKPTSNPMPLALGSVTGLKLAGSMPSLASQTRMAPMA